MRFANEAAATALCVLNKCSDEVMPDGPWRWLCAVQNGTRLPIAASLEEGFLHLACQPGTIGKSTCTLERALEGNSTLAGGVKLALSELDELDDQNKASSGLHLTTDIVVLDEKQLLDRFRLALDGFHHGVGLLKSLDSDGRGDRAATRRAVSIAGDLGELLRETHWPSTERGPNEFSANLDADSAPPATIRMTESGVELNVELVRSNRAASRRALAVFLLTATSALRMARVCAVEADGQTSFGLQVGLPAAPAMEEIDHALAALSIAHRICAREANVLLNDAAARCYLAARDVSTNHQPGYEEEN